MGRIRTIKPEFPQSESMGRVSRAARLCFVLLWTLADDSGRLRGNSRMLASLLFPYDDDAKDLIDEWLGELEAEGCVTRYRVSGDTYIAISKWLIHQKIDRPSQSKIPPLDESSRILANPREPSPLDQGPRIKDQGMEKDQGPQRTARPKGTRLQIDWSLPDDWRAWAESERPELDARHTAEQFRDYWIAKAGAGGTKLDWAATWRNWVRSSKGAPQKRVRQESFAERDRRVGIERWEEMTGREHPDHPDRDRRRVVDITPVVQRLAT